MLATPSSNSDGNIKEGFHARNKHRSRYDFDVLTKSCPELQPFVAVNRYGDLSIDFTNQTAVVTLNKALLAAYYGVEGWVIPPKFLTPPVPSRADYVHHLADLISFSGFDLDKDGPAVRVLDIGSGANAIYPLIGHAEYGFTYVGTDIDEEAIDFAKQIVTANRKRIAEDRITFRHQPDERDIFLGGIVRPGEKFVCSMCNPPFHGSQQEATESTMRKWRNLGKKNLITKSKGGQKSPVLNFGGSGRELIYPGGEMKFLLYQIRQSAHFSIRNNVLWFTSLVSKAENLDATYRFLEETPGMVEHLTVEMEHGNKKSRIVAWTYQDVEQRAAWVKSYLRTSAK
jgi:23S rRNA (adenine1618-N6)-methyltransferase